MEILLQRSVVQNGYSISLLTDKLLVEVQSSVGGTPEVKTMYSFQNKTEITVLLVIIYECLTKLSISYIY